MCDSPRRTVSLLIPIRYFGGPLIAVENSGGKWLHELDVCEECRLKRWVVCLADAPVFDRTAVTTLLVQADIF